jgi:hypothetical protein
VTKALEAHHAWVTQLGSSISWAVAVQYDIQQCGASASDPTHDLSTLDDIAVSLISANITIASSTAALAHIPNQSPSKCPHPFPESAEHQPHRSYTPASYSPVGGQNCCFWCGKSGHMPKNCLASSTKAGCALAPLSTELHSPNGLIAPNSTAFCFRFASATCVNGSSCSFHHGCSICRSTAHSACVCPSGH